MKKAVPMFVIAAMIVAMALIRLPDGVRSVDTVSLLGAGLLAGVLLMRGIAQMQAE